MPEPGNDERYEQVDLPFYRERIAPFLPRHVLDFHAHTWSSDQRKYVPWQTDAAGAKYLVTSEEYDIERLVADGEMLFPDRSFRAVCFGYPTPAADFQKTNDYLSGAGRHAGLFPLLNGMALLRRVRGGRQLEAALTRWNADRPGTTDRDW